MLAMRLWILTPLLALFSLAQAQEAAKSAPPVDPAIRAKALEIVQTLQQANEMLGNGQSDAALAKVNAALQADPRSVAGYLLRAAIYVQKKMWTEAQNDYETAHMISPHMRSIGFDLAEIQFAQKHYALARPGFVGLEMPAGTSIEKLDDLADLAAYKVFLCDLFGGNDALAAKELDAFNQVGANASYYFSNAAWDLVHHKNSEATGWLLSASNIYPPQKNGFYTASLIETGYLPLSNK